jgi:hypothetical protein
MPVSVDDPNHSLFEQLVKEVDRLKARQKAIDGEKKSAVKALNDEKKANVATLKALNVVILRFDGKAPSSNGEKRRRWPASVPKPMVCLIPAKLHNKDVSRKVKSFGLCASHSQKECKGTLSTEEKEAFDNALYKLGVIA